MSLSVGMNVSLCVSGDQGVSVCMRVCLSVYALCVSVYVCMFLLCNSNEYATILLLYMCTMCNPVNSYIYIYIFIYIYTFIHDLYYILQLQCMHVYVYI